MEQALIRAAAKNPGRIDVHLGFKLSDAFVRSVTRTEFGLIKSALSTFDGWEERNSKNSKVYGLRSGDVETVDSVTLRENVEADVDFGDGLRVIIVSVFSEKDGLSTDAVPFVRHTREHTFTRKNVTITLATMCDHSPFSSGDWLYSASVSCCKINDHVNCLRICTYADDLIRMVKAHRTHCTA